MICSKCGKEHNQNHYYCRECHIAYCKAYHRRKRDLRRAARRKTDRELAIILG